MRSSFDLKKFFIVFVLVSIWMQTSETIRYLYFVRPSVQEFFSTLADIAPMNNVISILWLFWVAVITAINIFVFWLFSQAFGNNNQTTFFSTLLTWVSCFAIFWSAMLLMALCSLKTAAIELSWSFVELLIASFITANFYKGDQFVADQKDFL